MPANLTPQYHKAEDEYRRAQTPDEELRCLQLMLKEMPKHKGTDKLQADLKQKISKARQETEQHAKSGSKKGPGVRIPRQGAGRAVVIGGPEPQWSGKATRPRRWAWNGPCQAATSSKRTFFVSLHSPGDSALGATPMLGDSYWLLLGTDIEGWIAFDDSACRIGNQSRLAY